MISILQSLSKINTSMSALMSTGELPCGHYTTPTPELEVIFRRHLSFCLWRVNVCGLWNVSEIQKDWASIVFWCTTLTIPIAHKERGCLSCHPGFGAVALGLMKLHHGAWRTTRLVHLSSGLRHVGYRVGRGMVMQQSSQLLVALG